ncbi:MAG: NAD(P)H-hydrate dehydratase, partial [Armatimonadetes bacterium]|nr:NAD(P)H-hydrate dehydratase [Akkermansiaceae bacterium]
GAAKRGLLMAHAANAVGSLALVAVDGLGSAGPADMQLISPQSMDFGKHPREFDYHKGKAGRLGILAGSPRYSGAAILTALGALRAGAGLITLHAPRAACNAIRSRLPVEVMLKVCDDPRDILDESYDALVVGPGLGPCPDSLGAGLRNLIESTLIPTLIDADGLNFVANDCSIKLDERHLLTPHPGEFKRLAPDLEGRCREEAARAFVQRCRATLLLKGCRTIVAKAGQPLRINSTGTPAMSNGGQGDLLSGVIGALMAGGMLAFDAGAYGAWLCGRAAELHVAAHGGIATATDTASQLGLAFGNWRTAQR